MTPPPMQNFPPASALFPFTSRNGLSKVASFSSASPSGKTKSASPQSPPLLLPTAQSLLTLRTPPMPLQKTRRLPKIRSEEHTSELQSLTNLVCRLLLEKKKRIRHSTCGHVR